jgi:hypothetical protein
MAASTSSIPATPEVSNMQIVTALTLAHIDANQDAQQDAQSPPPKGKPENFSRNAAEGKHQKVLIQGKKAPECNSDSDDDYSDVLSEVSRAGSVLASQYDRTKGPKQPRVNANADSWISKVRPKNKKAAELLPDVLDQPSVYAREDGKRYWEVPESAQSRRIRFNAYVAHTASAIHEQISLIGKQAPDIRPPSTKFTMPLSKIKGSKQYIQTYIKNVQASAEIITESLEKLLEAEQFYNENDNDIIIEQEEKQELRFKELQSDLQRINENIKTIEAAKETVEFIYNETKNPHPVLLWTKSKDSGEIKKQLTSLTPDRAIQILKHLEEKKEKINSKLNPKKPKRKAQDKPKMAKRTPKKLKITKK